MEKLYRFINATLVLVNPWINGMRLALMIFMDALALVFFHFKPRSGSLRLINSKNYTKIS